MENETKIMPIGTVVEIRGNSAMVAGYEYRAVENKLQLQYILLPFPRGYTNKGSVKIASPSECTAVSPGYDNELFRHVSEYFMALNQATEKFSAEEMIAAFREFEVSDNGK